MKMYPVMLNLKNKNCFIIGGGKVALRKAKKIQECGGKVTVIASEFHVDFGNIQTIRKRYSAEDIKKAFLVIAATDKREINMQIGLDASAMGILVSLADDAEHSDFISASSSVCGDISVSVSTNGKYPLLAAKLCRIKSEDLNFYNSLIPILEKYRCRIIMENGDTKKKLLEYIISDEMLKTAKHDITLFENKIKEIM